MDNAKYTTRNRASNAQDESKAYGDGRCAKIAKPSLSLAAMLEQPRDGPDLQRRALDNAQVESAPPALSGTQAIHHQTSCYLLPCWGTCGIVQPPKNLHFGTAEMTTWTSPLEPWQARRISHLPGFIYFPCGKSQRLQARWWPSWLELIPTSHQYLLADVMSTVHNTRYSRYCATEKKKKHFTE